MTPTFVLVPGAGGEARYWHLVVDRLAERGFGAVAVDLPGPDRDAGLTRYVDILRGAVHAIDGDVVLVGQSLGGFSSAWVAGLEPVEELVLLNAMVPTPDESAGQWWEATGQAAAMRAADVASGRDPDAAFDLGVRFLHDVPLEALAGAGEQREESDAVFGAPWGLAAWPDVPTRVLVGADDRLFPADFQQRVAWQRIGQDVVHVPGGHLAALSQPDAVVDELVRHHQ